MHGSWLDPRLNEAMLTPYFCRGHKVGMLVLVAGGVEDAHAQVDAFMARYPNFFNTWDVRVTLASWQEIMGISS